MKKPSNPVNLQTFRQTYDLLMEGIQGRSRYHSQTENAQAYQANRIHAPMPMDHKRKLPELKVRDTKIDLIETHNKKQVSPTSQASRLQDTKRQHKSPNPVAMKMDPKVKRALSIQCKGNFIQFLVVQRAGKVYCNNKQEQGDYRMYERFKDLYQDQLFDIERPKAMPRIDKRKISYLKIEEENPEEIENQVRLVLSKKKAQDRGITPLDTFIRKVHESNAPRFPKLSNDQSYTSNIDSFDI